MARPAEEPKRKTFTLPTDGALLELDLALGGAGYDPLTGCLSYGRMLEAVGSEIQRSQRRGARLCCCFLGLGGFNRANDVDARLVRHQVLAAAGEALRAGVRSYDSVGRFDGDQFMVMLPETGAQAAVRIGERLRAGVRAAVAATTDLPLDVSVGIVEWNKDDSALDLTECGRQGGLRG